MFPVKKNRVRSRCPTLKTTQVTVPSKISFHKQIQIFKYMGESAPMCFTNTSENIVISGMLPPLVASITENEIHNEIVAVVRAEGEMFEDCAPNDFEFIRSSRRTAQVPTVKHGFKWDGSAVKNLARQGSIYVWLTKQFTEMETEHDDSFTEHHDDMFSDVLVDEVHVVEENILNEDSSSSDDFVIKPPKCRFQEGSSSSADNYRIPMSVPEKSYINQGDTKESLFDQICIMFPSEPKERISALLKIECYDLVDAILCTPSLDVIIEKIKAEVGDDRVALTLDEDDEDDLVFNVFEFYKAKVFNPKLNLRVRFRNQPGIDAGGVRRQMFSNIYSAITTSKNIGLFYQGEKSLLLRFNVQNIFSEMMTIVGRIIAHATALEGIGFPYLSKASYWYLATCDENVVVKNGMLLTHSEV